MEKLNIAEILKDCPSGMELDSTLFEGLEFDCIVDNEYLPIRCRIKHPNGGYTVYNFTKYGCWLDTTFAKCVIFPKGKTTWEGFQRPFKDGDVVVCEEDKKITQMFILKSQIDNMRGYCHTGYDFMYNEFFEEGNWYFDRLATSEEKQKLFDAIKDNGYKWNAKTKTLEKLIKPKFKVGDVIQDKDGYKVKITDVSVEDECYGYESTIVNGIGGIAFNRQDDWKLVPNKFDITTLKPFNEVLVRQNNHGKWGIDFFGFYSEGFYYTTGSAMYVQCVPYEGNEHLRGTTNDCDEYYKTWK